jgi:hypothetical protein
VRALWPSELHLHVYARTYLCACVCVRTCVCLCVHMRVCMCMYVRICVRVCVCAYVYACIVYVLACVYSCIRACVRALCTCVYVCACVCVRTYVYVRVRVRACTCEGVEDALPLSVLPPKSLLANLPSCLSPWGALKGGLGGFPGLSPFMLKNSKLTPKRALRGPCNSIIKCARNTP